MNVGCERSMQITSKTIPNAVTTFLDRGNFHNTCFEAIDFLCKRSRSIINSANTVDLATTDSTKSQEIMVLRVKVLIRTRQSEAIVSLWILHARTAWVPIRIIISEVKLYTVERVWGMRTLRITT